MTRCRAGALMVGAVLLVGCSTKPAAVPAGVAGPSPTYVAVGASESVGSGADQPLVEAWTQVFYRTALPIGATFVNAGIPGATVADALEKELPLAIEQHPAVVTVWLNVNDLVAAVPAAEYESGLRRLVHALRQDGRATVLVANTPPLDHLPAYLAEAGSDFPPVADVLAAVDAYDAAIGRVVAEEGAVLVDLHAAGLAARADGTEAGLVSSDGFHPSTAGHARVAAAFADAYRTKP